MKDDPTIAAIREVRHQISEEHGHDPKLVVEYYIERQRRRTEQRTEKASAHPEIVAQQRDEADLG